MNVICSFSFVLYLSPIILVSYELPTRLSCHKFLPKWCIYLILYNFFVHKLPSASVLDERNGRNGEKASIIKQTWARRLFFHSSNTFLLSVCLITNMITNVLKMAQVAKWGGINNKADRGGWFFRHSNSSYTSVFFIHPTHTDLEVAKVSKKSPLRQNGF